MLITECSNLVRRLEQLTKPVKTPEEIAAMVPRPADDSPNATEKKYPARIKRSAY